MANIEFRDRRRSGFSGTAPQATVVAPPPAPGPAPNYDSGTGFHPMPTGPGRTIQPVPLERDPNPVHVPPPPQGGGHLAGVGATIAPGRSTTSAEATKYVEQARSAGVPQSFIDEFLRTDPGDYNRIESVWRDRAADAASGGGGGGTGDFPMMFDDPATAQLEALLRQQMAELSRPNPQLDQLVNFLNTQFRDLSQHPGYSPEELAVLRTQAFEPTEAYRQASKQRALERASERGLLPSSGVHELDMRDIDIQADRARTALDRDLAINQITERTNDIARALNMGTQAYEIPMADTRQRQADLLSRSSLLYDLPQRALQQVLAVLGQSSTPESLFSQANQAAQTSLQQQQLNQRRMAAVWEAIGNAAGNWRGR